VSQIYYHLVHAVQSALSPSISVSTLMHRGDIDRITSKLILQLIN